MSKFQKGMVNAVILSILRAINAGDNKKAIVQCAKLANLAKKLNIRLESVLTKNVYKAITNFLVYGQNFKARSVSNLAHYYVFHVSAWDCLPSKV